MSSGFTCISYEKSDFSIPCPELIRDSEISICHVLHCPSFPITISYRILIICCDICKTLSYSCIEVKDKHRVCLPTVMVQNTEYFGLYRDSQLCCDVTPSSRISYGAIDNSYGQCLIFPNVGQRSRSHVQKFWYQRKGHVTRNTRVKYESSTSNSAKVMANVKVFADRQTYSDFYTL